MKESSVYTHFFYKYRLAILIPSFLALVISVIFEISKPVIYEYQSVYEYPYKEATINQDVIAAEQLVGVIREKYPTQNEVSVTFFRSAPLTIHFVSSSINKDSAKNIFQEYNQEISQNYKLKPIVLNREYQTGQFNWLVVLAAVITTIFTSIFVSSLYQYFKSN